MRSGAGGHPGPPETPAPDRLHRDAPGPDARANDRPRCGPTGGRLTRRWRGSRRGEVGSECGVDRARDGGVGGGLRADEHGRGAGGGGPGGGICGGGGGARRGEGGRPRPRRRPGPGAGRRLAPPRDLEARPRSFRGDEKGRRAVAADGGAGLARGGGGFAGVDQIRPASRSPNDLRPRRTSRCWSITRPAPTRPRKPPGGDAARAVGDAGFDHVVVVYPNNDPGSEGSSGAGNGWRATRDSSCGATSGGPSFSA